MRLIDADALLAAFEKDISEQIKHMELLKFVGDMKHYYDISKVQIGMVSCRRMLENAPIIIDTVPVVRCAECKWFQCNMSMDGYLPKGVDEFECRHWCGSCDPVDFCSYGERKEE